MSQHADRRSSGAHGRQGDDAAPLVEAKGVVKTYRAGSTEVQALRGADLRIERGEMVAVVGPSGSGKTTLLNCMSGLDDIDGGVVEVAGENLDAMSDRERTTFRGREMGFIFQAFNLVSVFTAAENVELPVLLTDAGPRAARRRARDVLSQVGLSERLDHLPSELSGGEQQRVAIARALAPRPAIVWTDEPTGNLDTDTADRVMELLGRLHEEGLTIVLVTHERAIARRAERLVTMRDGVIVDDEMQP